MNLYEDDIERLEKIRDYIHSNLDKDLSISIFVKMFCIDKYKLRRHFHKYFHVPPHQYIHEIRMKTAMQLLKDNIKSIYETGLAVGYQDKSAFSHTFTKFVGKSPSVFRQENSN